MHHTAATVPLHSMSSMHATLSSGTTDSFSPTLPLVLPMPCTALSSGAATQANHLHLQCPIAGGTQHSMEPAHAAACPAAAPVAHPLPDACTSDSSESFPRPRRKRHVWRSNPVALKSMSQPLPNSNVCLYSNSSSKSPMSLQKLLPCISSMPCVAGSPMSPGDAIAAMENCSMFTSFDKNDHKDTLAMHAHASNGASSEGRSWSLDRLAGVHSISLQSGARQPRFSRVSVNTVLAHAPCTRTFA